MPDQLTDPVTGPDSMYSTELPVSRGQWHAIAAASVELLGLQQPTTRLDGTILLTRLRLAAQDHPAPRASIDPIPEF